MTKEQLKELLDKSQSSGKSLEERVVFLILLLKIYLNEGPPLKVNQGIRYMIPELSDFVIFV